MISAEDLGGLLSCIHTHAGLLLKLEHIEQEKELMANPDQIVYKEEDVIALLKKLGFPEPVWGSVINLKDYKLPEPAATSVAIKKYREVYNSSQTEDDKLLALFMTLKVLIHECEEKIQKRKNDNR
jgi:hypothetical protein